MTLPNGVTIRLVSAPYFLITKLEAFKGRGRGDYMASHDMEDIISVLDGRPGIVSEVRNANPALIASLSRYFKQLLADQRFIEAVPGHMPADPSSEVRLQNILKVLQRLANF